MVGVRFACAVLVGLMGSTLSRPRGFGFPEAFELFRFMFAGTNLSGRAAFPRFDLAPFTTADLSTFASSSTFIALTNPLIRVSVPLAVMEFLDGSRRSSTPV